MMTVCAECGKRIVVTWPEFYVYKRGKGEDTCYFCSENCMIVSDVRDTKERSGWNDEPWITEGELEDIQAGRKPFRMLRRPTSRNSRPPAEKDRPGKPAERTGQEMGNNKSSHKLTREEKEKAVELAIAGKDPIGYLKECGCKNPWASWAYIKNVLKKSKPELYAQLPGDDDRLGEEVPSGRRISRRYRRTFKRLRAREILRLRLAAPLRMTPRTRWKGSWRLIRARRRATRRRTW